jgi:hypothetical protein
MGFPKPGFSTTLLTIAALFMASACGENGNVLSGAGAPNAAWQASISQTSGVMPSDNTSILKRLDKDVAIGSTVDAKNGDAGPHALSVVQATFGLKRGQLVVCNFANKAGKAGKGSTIEVLNPKPGSKHVRFAESKDILGCTGDALSAGNDVFGAGWGSHILEEFDQDGEPLDAFGPPIVGPFADADAFCSVSYYPEYIYEGDAKTGSIVHFSVNLYGNPTEVQVIAGFAINKGKGWGVLGPSGIQYDGRRRASLCNDTLYIVDGVDNTIVAVSNSSSLLLKNEIVVKPGGKTFKCLYKKTTCAKLVYAGSPLDAPYASTLLPNGNLIVANTAGGNKLVELTPAGKVLAIKAVDKSARAHVFGLASIGTSDTNTVVYYTTTADNTVHELMP